MVLATASPLLPRMAELVTSFGLTLFLQSGLLVGLGLLGSWRLRKRGAAPLSTLLRLTLTAVATCPFIAMSWHLSGFRLQPFRLPTIAPQAEPAASAVLGEPSLATNPASADVPTVKATHRVPTRPTPARKTAPLGNVPEPVDPYLFRMTDLRENRTIEADPRERQSADPSDSLVLGAEQAAQLPARQSWLSGTWSVSCVSFALGWPLVSGILFARLALAWWRMRRVCREARPAPGPVQAACVRLAEEFGVQAPQVLISPQAPVPCLLGIRNPVILYPAGERTTTVEVLCHELAHLARRDCVWFLVGHIVQAILFFQPLLRVLIREFERASDDVCDDLVLQYSTHRRRYARELVRIAQTQQVRHDRLLAALGAVSFRSRLGKRIERIVNLSRTLSPRTGRRERLALTAAALSCTLVIALIQVGAAPAAATDERTPAVAEPSPTGRTNLPDESRPAPLALGANLSEESTVSTSKAAHRPASRDPAVGEAMRTRVNSWLASAASAVRQSAMTQSDKPAERETPEQPSSEPASGLLSSRPADNTRATTVPDESVVTPPDDNERARAVSSLKRIELQGTVYDNDGRPAADAEVWAYPFGDNFWQMVESRTGAEGRFKLDLTPGEWRVLARKDNRMGGANNIYGLVGIVASNPPEPCIIRLTPGGTLRGRLFDKESGEPIRYGRIWIDDCGLVQADENGRYEVRGLSRHPHHLVTLSPGYGRGYVLLDTSLRPEAELDLRLTRAGRITGKVVDSGGRPIPNARCGYGVSGNTTAIVALFEGCDEKGEFAWDGAAYDRPMRLEAEAPGYASEEKEITVTKGSAPPYVVFRLKREVPENDKGQMRSITGMVRTSDGKAVRAAKVCFHYNYMQSRRWEATTDTGGRFALRRVPDQIGYLVATAANHSPAFASVLRSGHVNGDLVLDSGRTVRGKVQDANGDPREGIVVLPVAAAGLQTACIEPWVWQLHTVTDRDGRFDLRGLPADGFRYDFFDPENNRTSRLGLQDNGVITMAGPGAFRGRVVDPQGHPVRDFRIMLDLTECVPTRPTFQSPSVNGADPNAHTTGIYAGLRSLGVLYTSADGTFVLSGVAETNINTVIAQVPGYGRAVVDGVRARVLEKLGPPEELTLQLAQPHQLRVRVVQEKEPDTPIVSASVGLVPYGWQAGAGYRHPAPYFWWDSGHRIAVLRRTDENGWASFPDLSLDEGTVIVQAEGFARQRLEWRAGNPDKPDLIVRLKPECVIAGVLRSPSGNGPLRDFRARLERGHWKDFSKNPNGEISKPGQGTWCHEDSSEALVGPSEKGQFRFSGLPAGRYLLLVRTSELERPPYQFYREEFTLGEGESHEIDTIASNPVPLDPWNRPVTAASRNGTFFPRRGVIGFMAGSPNGGQPGGR